MESLFEKRKIIHAWIDKAGEQEVDQLLEKILDREKEYYNQKLTEELLHRRQMHLDGISESFSREEVQAKLEAIMKGHGV